MDVESSLSRSLDPFRPPRAASGSASRDGSPPRAHVPTALLTPPVFLPPRAAPAAPAHKKSAHPLAVPKPPAPKPSAPKVKAPPSPRAVLAAPATKRVAVAGGSGPVPRAAPVKPKKQVQPKRVRDDDEDEDVADDDDEVEDDDSTVMDDSEPEGERSEDEKPRPEDLGFVVDSDDEEKVAREVEVSKKALKKLDKATRESILKRELLTDKQRVEQEKDAFIRNDEARRAKAIEKVREENAKRIRKHAVKAAAAAAKGKKIAPVKLLDEPPPIEAPRAVGKYALRRSVHKPKDPYVDEYAREATERLMNARAKEKMTSDINQWMVILAARADVRDADGNHVDVPRDADGNVVVLPRRDDGSVHLLSGRHKLEDIEQRFKYYREAMGLAGSDDDDDSDVASVDDKDSAYEEEDESEEEYDASDDGVESSSDDD